VLIWFVAAAWAVLLLVHFALWLEGVNEGNWPSVIARPWLVVSVALAVRGRRMRAGSAERALAGDTRAPVVYLRPFAADGAQIAKRWSSRIRIAPTEHLVKTRYEDRLARAAQGRAVPRDRRPDGAPAAARGGAHVRGREAVSAAGGDTQLACRSGLFRRRGRTRAAGRLGGWGDLVQPAQRAQHLRPPVPTLPVLPHEVRRARNEQQVEAPAEGKPRRSRHAAVHRGSPVPR